LVIDFHPLVARSHDSLCRAVMAAKPDMQEMDHGWMANRQT
jgi:hypothetical protein